MAKTYQRSKEAARQAAMDWQNEAAKGAMYYSDLEEAGNRFHKLGKRFGLLQEFRENAIPC